MVSPPENYKRTYRIVSSKYPPISGSGTFRWGSRWISPGRYVVHAAESAILWVPSLVSPVEFNLMLHQEHEDFDHIIVREALPVLIDPRLRTASRPTGK